MFYFYGETKATRTERVGMFNYFDEVTLSFFSVERSTIKL